MRLPRTWLKYTEKKDKSYNAIITVEIYPGVNINININKLAQEPNFACCTRKENKLCHSYIITLFSSKGPFASLYVTPPWFYNICKQRN